MLHDAESKIYQKLLIRDWFPGRYSIGNIWRTENAKRKKKCFLEPTFKALSIYIYGEACFSAWIFNIYDI